MLSNQLNLCESTFNNPKLNQQTGEYDTATLLKVNTRGAVMDTYLANTKPLFEWTKLSDIVQPYFDVDYYAEGEDDYKHSVELVLNESVDAICNEFPDVRNQDLRISSYNGLTNEGKWKVSYHIIIHGYRVRIACLKEVAKRLHDANDNIDTSVYRKAGLMRVGGHHKAPPKPNTRTPKLLYWCADSQQYEEVHNANKSPQGIALVDFRYQHMIQYADHDAPLLIEEQNPQVCTAEVPSPQPQSQPQPEPDANYSVNDALLASLSSLPDVYVNDRGKWWYISSLLKAIGEKATWDTWSKQSSKYDVNKNNKIWSQISVSMSEQEAQTKLAKKIKYETDLIERVHKACVDGSTEDMCALFIHEYQNYWRVVSYPKLIYMFDKDDCLWKMVPEQRFNTFITEHFGPIRSEYIHQLNTSPSKFIGGYDKMPEKAQKKAVLNATENASVNKNSFVKNSFRIEFFNRKEIQDPLFTQKLNSNPDVLSTLDGVVDLRTGTFRKRKYDDYLSKCLEITYDPVQTNSEFEQFMYDIFDHPELNTEMIRDFMQVFFGYSITGHNSAHKCVILHGSGGNGKSVLNDCLFKVLSCKFGQMVNSWDSKFMDDNKKDDGDTDKATPELAKLVDCNLGIINETKKSMTFGVAFKKWNDTCHKFGYRPLYSQSLFARLITTFMISTNHFPQFPIEDAYIRRILPIPMWMKFKANPNPTKPNEKQKDEGLFARMTGTTELMQGMLNWFIQGSIKWYANNKKLYDLPPCVEAQKQRYIDGNDWTRLFQAGEDNGIQKDSTMWMSDVMHLIRVNSIDGECKLKQKEIMETLKERGATASRVMHVNKKEVLFRYLREAQSNQDEEEEDIM